MKHHIMFLCSVCVAVMMTPERARSQTRAALPTKTAGTLASSHLSASRSLRKGTLRTMGSKRVEVGPGKTQTLSVVANQVFSQQNRMARTLRGASAGTLFGQLSVRDEVHEMSNSFLLVRSTSGVIADPVKARKRSTVLARALGNPTSTVAVTQLNARAKLALRQFRNNAKLYSSGHPLKGPAMQSEQALLNAVVSGKGAFEVVDTFIVPKKSLKVQQGKIFAPRLKRGTFDFKSIRQVSARSSATGVTAQTRPASTSPRVRTIASRTSHARGGGTHHFEAKFLNGFTFGDSWLWERTWRFPSGLFRVKAGAWYGVGLRIPIRIKGNINPRSLSLAHSKDAKQSYSVKFKAETINGNPAFYKSVGLPQGKVFKGKELVLTLGYGYGYKFRALWTDVAEKPYREYPAIEEGRDFLPPLGSRYKKIKDVFVPASLTNTQFGAGPLKGSLRFAARIKANGKIKVKYSALYDGRKRVSYKKSDTSRRLNTTWDVTSLSASTQHWHVSPLPLQGRSSTKRFGYQFDSVRYLSKWGVTPGVALDITAGYKSISKRYDFTLWFDSFTIDVAKTTLTTHAGTKGALAEQPGQKRFQRTP